MGGNQSSPYRTADDTPAFVLTTDRNAACRISQTDTNFSSMTWGCAGDGSLVHTCTAPVTFAPGNHIIYASCRDAAGIENNSSNNEDIPFTVVAPTPTT